MVLRVRGFTRMTRIYLSSRNSCRMKIKGIIDFVFDTMVFGFKDLKIELSTRPQVHRFR